MPQFSDTFNPQDELAYRINIDIADLQTQLQNVRNQINEAVSSGQGFSTPGVQSFTAPTIGTIETSQQRISEASATTFAAMTAATQRFSADTQQAMNYVSNVQFGNPWSTLGATWGLGWNREMPVGRHSYMESASNELEFRMLEGGFRGGGLAIGTALGAPLGHFGAAAGGWLGEKVGGGLYGVWGGTIGRGAVSQNELAEYVSGTSWRFSSGGFNPTQAREISRQAHNVLRDPELEGEFLKRADLRDIVAEYTELGGFDFVRTAEEFSTKLRDVVTQHRDVMRTLRVSQSEALQIMREMDVMGIGADGGYTDMGIRMSAMARASGYRGEELHQFAKQTAQMAQGYGFAAPGGYQAGPQALAYLRQTGTGISPHYAQMMGGLEGITGQHLQAGYSWLSGPAGWAYAASGGGGYATHGDRLYGALGNIQNPEQLLQSHYTQFQVGSQTDPLLAAGFSYMDTMKLLDTVGVNPLNHETWMGYHLSRGEDPMKAAEAYRFLVTLDANKFGRDFDMEERAYRDTLPGVIPTLWQRHVSNPIAKTTDELGVVTGRISGNVAKAYQDWQNRTREFFGIPAYRDSLGQNMFSRGLITDELFDEYINRRLSGDAVSTQFDALELVYGSNAEQREVNRARAIENLQYNPYSVHNPLLESDQVKLDRLNRDTNTLTGGKAPTFNVLFTGALAAYQEGGIEALEKYRDEITAKGIDWSQFNRALPFAGITLGPLGVSAGIMGWAGKILPEAKSRHDHPFWSSIFSSLEEGHESYMEAAMSMHYDDFIKGYQDKEEIRKATHALIGHSGDPFSDPEEAIRAMPENKRKIAIQQLAEASRSNRNIKSEEILDNTQKKYIASTIEQYRNAVADRNEMDVDLLKDTTIENLIGMDTAGRTGADVHAIREILTNGTITVRTTQFGDRLGQGSM